MKEQKIIKTVSNNIVASIATETLKRSNNSINDNQKDFNPIGEKMLNNIENENWKPYMTRTGNLIMSILMTLKMMK